MVSLSVILRPPAFFTYFYDARYRDATWIAAPTGLQRLVRVPPGGLGPRAPRWATPVLFIANTTKVIVLVGCSPLGFHGLFGSWDDQEPWPDRRRWILRLRAQRVPSGWMDFKCQRTRCARPGRYVAPAEGVSAQRGWTRWRSCPSRSGSMILGPDGRGGWSAKRVKNAIKKPGY